MIAKKALGQHFLVDENILGVISRLAGLEQSDNVLEVGPGLGVLTAYLAARVAHVDAIEIDRSLGPALSERLGEATNVTIHFGDALSLSPSAHELLGAVALSAGAQGLWQTWASSPQIQLWCVMVQREVADRLFASPGTKAYGAVSVLIQLSARRSGFHAVSREVFRPRPRVESALVAFTRIPPPERFGEIKMVVNAAFAHRRKTLANSLSLSGVASRERAEAALLELSRDRRSRAEALVPAEFVALTEALR